MERTGGKSPPWSTAPLPARPSPTWPRVVAPITVLYSRGHHLLEQLRYAPADSQQGHTDRHRRPEDQALRRCRAGADLHHQRVRARRERRFGRCHGLTEPERRRDREQPGRRQPHAINVDPGTLAASNYTFAAQAGTLTVNQAHLTVTADNQSKIQGNPNPTLTYTITGFVNGDTSSVVSGTPVLSTTATAGSPAGNYPITVSVGTLSAANYDFPNLVSGTLTVVAKTGVSVTVSPNSSPSTYGQAVTFSVSVSPTSADPTPTGTVQFQADGVNFGSAITLVNGAATAQSVRSQPVVTPSPPSTPVIRLTLAPRAQPARQSTGPTSRSPPTTRARFRAIPTPRSPSPSPALSTARHLRWSAGLRSSAPTATTSSPVGSYPITIAAGTLRAANYDFPLPI